MRSNGTPKSDSELPRYNRRRFSDSARHPFRPRDQKRGRERHDRSPKGHNQSHSHPPAKAHDSAPAKQQPHTQTQVTPARLLPQRIVLSTEPATDTHHKISGSGGGGGSVRVQKPPPRNARSALAGRAVQSKPTDPPFYNSIHMKPFDESTLNLSANPDTTPNALFMGLSASRAAAPAPPAPAPAPPTPAPAATESTSDAAKPAVAGPAPKN